MDRVGLKEVLNVGVRVATNDWKHLTTDLEEAGVGDVDLDAVLARFVDIGQLALEHEVEWLWNELIDAMLRVYQLGVPQEHRLGYPQEPEAVWMARVAQRVLILGAVAHRLRRYSFIPNLILQSPVEQRPSNYWLRYAVTMASRGEVADVFKGKSLIGPASEVVRGLPAVWGLFNENMDEVVNHMCQFDFLACVITIVSTQDATRCYPNFGGYFSHRTEPVVRSLVKHEPVRAAIGDVTDQQLAQILLVIDSIASKAFFSIAGWDGYEDNSVRDFLNAHAQR